MSDSILRFFEDSNVSYDTDLFADNEFNEYQDYTIPEEDGIDINSESDKQDPTEDEELYSFQIQKQPDFRTRNVIEIINNFIEKTNIELSDGLISIWKAKFLERVQKSSILNGHILESKKKLKHKGLSIIAENITLCHKDTGNIDFFQKLVLHLENKDPYLDTKFMDGDIRMELLCQIESFNLKKLKSII